MVGQSIGEHMHCIHKGSIPFCSITSKETSDHRQNRGLPKVSDRNSQPEYNTLEYMHRKLHMIML